MNNLYDNNLDIDNMYDEEYKEDKSLFRNEHEMNKNVRESVYRILQEQISEVGNGNSMNSTIGATKGIMMGGCAECRPITGNCSCCGGSCSSCGGVIVGGKFDIVKGITGLFPNKEFHLTDQGNDGKIRKASFCGPGTNLNKRLENFNPNTGSYTKVLTPPINQLDQGCLSHDVAYSKYKDVDNRHKADRELVKHADTVINNRNSTRTQKFNANLVKYIMKAKLLFGVGQMFDDMDQMYYDEYMN